MVSRPFVVFANCWETVAKTKENKFIPRWQKIILNWILSTDGEKLEIHMYNSNEIDRKSIV